MFILHSKRDNHFPVQLQRNKDHYVFIPTASISITNGDYIISNDESGQRNASVSYNFISIKFIILSFNNFRLLFVSFQQLEFPLLEKPFLCHGGLLLDQSLPM